MTVVLDDREPYGKRLPDYVALLIRRRLLLVLPAIAISAATVAVTFLLPPVYRSTATVLIEEPEVPRNIIQTTVTGAAQQRLQIIRQRVMTTENLKKIIDKYKLYIAERKVKPLTTIIERFRNNLYLEMVTSGTRFTGIATIAFKLSYESSNPGTAQRITNELVSLYLSENLRGRQTAVKETVRFLAKESNDLAKRLEEFEVRISRFKQENKGRLPGQMNMNLGIISNLRGELRQLNLQVRSMENTKFLLESQLAEVSEFLTPNDVQSQPTLSLEEKRLEALRSELKQLRSLYTDRHPDVIQLEKKISALEQNSEESGKQDTEEVDLQAARLHLARLEKSYGREHPDVRLARRRLEDLKSRFTSSNPSKTPGTDSVQNRNPIYLRISAQLAKLEFDIQPMRERKESLIAQLKIYEQRTLEIPEVERHFKNLIRDQANTRARYSDIKDKQIKAELARSLESERKAERFTLIEPPQLPSKPIKPKKLLIILGGILGGLVTGLGMVLIRDALDNAVYGPRHLAAVIGEAPLITIPIVRTRADTIRRIAISIFWCITVFGGIFGSAVAAHVFWRPLDVLWYSAISKYGF